MYKVVTVHAMKAYSKGRGIAPLIPNLGKSFRTRPLHPPVKNPEHPLNSRLGGGPTVSVDVSQKPANLPAYNTTAGAPI